MDPYSDGSEPAESVRGFDDYFSLGNGRTFAKLAQFYRDNPAEAPSCTETALKGYFHKYNWKARAAEREARIAEKTEAVMETDRVALKNRRLREQAHVQSLSMRLIKDCEDAFTGSHRDVVAIVDGCDPNTGTPIYRYEVQMVPNLSQNDLLKLFPKLVDALFVSHREQKQEMGEDGQRLHVTIEQVVRALPEPLQAPMREALYEELMKPQGLEMLPPHGA